MRKIQYIINAVTLSSIEHKILYVHLPKCGGTSLKNAITSRYGMRAYMSPNHVFHLDAASSVKTAASLGVNLYEHRKQILYYAMNSKAKFISGHFPFGEDIYNQFYPMWRFITILREPVNKWISNYYYNKYNNDPKHVWKIGANIEEFIDSDRASAYGSDYVDQIVGMEHVSKKESIKKISKAISLLEKFDVVGILEDMEKFKKDFLSMFGVKLQLFHENSSPLKNRQSSSTSGLIMRQEISEEMLNKIKVICEPNIEVYNFFLNK